MTSRSCLALTLIVVLALAAGAQTPAKSESGEDMKYNDYVDVSLFGGGSFFNQVYSGLVTKHQNGGVGGVSVTGNFWKYVGLEFGYRYGTNNLKFGQGNPMGFPTYSFGSRLQMFNLNPVFNFTPRGSAFRPYVTVGISSVDFRPTQAAIANAGVPLNAAVYGTQGLKSTLNPGINYGGGLKLHLNDWIGFHVDVRGITSRNPTYGLPNNAPPVGVYIPRRQMQTGVQTTAGIDFFWGKKEAPLPPPPPPAPAKPEALPNLIPGVIHGYEGTHYTGEPMQLTLQGASDPAGKPVDYRWKIDGASVGTGTSYTYTPMTAGPHSIEVEETAPNNEGYPMRTAKAGPVSVNVLEPGSPRVSVSANPSTVNAGDPSNLTVTSSPGDGAKSVTNRLTASEGTVTGSGTNFRLDTSTVKFDETSGKPQTKTVTITATATNDRGKSSTATTSVTVNYKPKALRFSDIIFSKGSARVNNCGKRILLDELAAKAADDTFDVVLVGHIDADEARKGRQPAGVKPLDYKRALQAAAVLTAGTGTCAKVDPSKVKIATAGTEQITDPQPGLCGTSARAATKERSGSAVSTTDQNRRVEVWLVPKGTEPPASAKNMSVVPARELKAAGCPR